MSIPGLSTAGQPQSRAFQQGGLPTLTIDGFAVLGSVSRFQPQDYWDPERNYDANLSWIKGNDNLRFGFDSDIHRSKELQWQAPSGNYISSAGGVRFAQGTTQLKTATGTSSGSDYNAFASFLLGYSQESGKVYQWPDYYYTSNKYFGLFVRDQWQVTPKLTLNIGVRADYFFVPVRNGTGTEYFDETRGKMIICGVASVPTDCGIYDQYKLRWAPRFGAASRITDRTVIRAGFGITS